MGWFQKQPRNFRDERRRSAVAVAILLLLTEAIYLRPSILQGTHGLLGLDYLALHIRRIAFARKALFGARHGLPGWYPYEVLGTPFAANLQSFPWIPTRLMLLALDPGIAYAWGVAIAAALAALFTYLCCRRAGLSRVGAVAAGWTFACGGFFASRVMAGHLPMLEAYPSLPLLLWLADRALAPERATSHRFDLSALAVSSACVAAAGHPQIPAYSLATALVYVGWRGRGRLRLKLMSAIALGVGATLAIWWPMLLLIGRSTRVLHLASPDNDIVMPYRRLLALIRPGIHGWVEPVQLAAQNPFTGYPNNAYFWDTASYIGILPLLAIGALAIGCLAKKRLPAWRWTFLAALGLGAFLCALPVVEPLRRIIPGTLFRSPARLLYLSTFSAAVALGAGADAIRHATFFGLRASRLAVLAVCLGVHFLDLGGFARLFVQPIPRQVDTPEFQSILDREVGSGRIAADRDLSLPYMDRYDDVGGFDSIFLARFYRGILALTGAPPDHDELLNGSGFPVAALEATGVRFVVTPETRMDLALVASTEGANLYRVPNPAPRAAFFREDLTEFLPEQQIPEQFAAHPRDGKLLLPSDAQRYLTHIQGVSLGNTAPSQSLVHYSRPDPDEILLEMTTPQTGYVQVLESFDPGWTAEADGAAAPIVPANGFSMAVPVLPGHHVIRLRYRTPGRTMGCVLSLASLCGLIALIWPARFKQHQA